MKRLAVCALILISVSSWLRAMSVDECNDLLARALRDNSCERAQQALVGRADPNCRVDELSEVESGLVRNMLPKGWKNSNLTLFQVAILHSPLPLVRLLHTYDADSNARDKEGDTPVHCAAYVSFEKVKFLVEECKANIHAIDQFGRTMAVLACVPGARDALAIVKYAHSKEVCFVAYDNLTALHVAACGGHLDAMLFLLEKVGIGANEKSWNKGFTPAHYACLSDAVGSLDVLKLLESHGADLSDPSSDNFTTCYDFVPANLAARNGHTAIVRYLIKEKGVDPKMRGDVGKSVLLFACENGSADAVEIVKFLLANGSDLTEYDNCSWGAEHRAASALNSEVLKFLVDNGHVNLTPADVLRLVFIAARYRSAAVMRYLLAREPKPNINGTDQKSETPLLAACFSEMSDRPDLVEVIKVLCENGADVTVRDKNNDTVLIAAALGGYMRTVDYLLKHPNVSVTDVNKDGYNALHAASLNGYSSIVKLLCAHKDKDKILNVSHEKDGTPLQMAARNGYTYTVECLLDCGACIKETRVGQGADFSDQQPLCLFLKYLAGHKFGRTYKNGFVIESEAAYKKRINHKQSTLTKLMSKSDWKNTSSFKCDDVLKKYVIMESLRQHPVRPLQILLKCHLAQCKEFYPTKDCVMAFGNLPTADQSIGVTIYRHVLCAIVNDWMAQAAQRVKEENSILTQINTKFTEQDLTELWNMTHERIQEIVKTAEKNALKDKSVVSIVSAVSVAEEAVVEKNEEHVSENIWKRLGEQFKKTKDKIFTLTRDKKT